MKETTKKQHCAICHISSICNNIPDCRLTYRYRLRLAYRQNRMAYFTIVLYNMLCLFGLSA